MTTAQLDPPTSTRTSNSPLARAIIGRKRRSNADAGKTTGSGDRKKARHIAEVLALIETPGLLNCLSGLNSGKMRSGNFKSCFFHMAAPDRVFSRESFVAYVRDRASANGVDFAAALLLCKQLIRAFGDANRPEDGISLTPNRVPGLSAEEEYNRWYPSPSWTLTKGELKEFVSEELLRREA